MSFLQILIATYFLFIPIKAHADYAGPPPVLLAIAQCESHQSQYCTEDTYGLGTCSKKNLGKVLTNKTGDYGFFQINKIHIKTAQKMGYDIMTEEGNTAYAIYLFSQNGTRDWNSSKSCWSKIVAESDV